MSREYFECHVSFQIAAGKKGEPPNGASCSRVFSNLFGTSKYIKIIKLSVAFGDLNIFTCSCWTQRTHRFLDARSCPGVEARNISAWRWCFSLHWSCVTIASKKEPPPQLLQSLPESQLLQPSSPKKLLNSSISSIPFRNFFSFLCYACHVVGGKVLLEIQHLTPLNPQDPRRRWRYYSMMMGHERHIAPLYGDPYATMKSMACWPASWLWLCLGLDLHLTDRRRFHSFSGGVLIKHSPLRKWPRWLLHSCTCSYLIFIQVSHSTLISETWTCTHNSTHERQQKDYWERKEVKFLTQNAFKKTSANLLFFPVSSPQSGSGNSPIFQRSAVHKHGFVLL